jgi:hypothetical protein
VSALHVDLYGVDEREDAELAELAALLRERNALDARLGRLLDRPVNTGSIGLCEAPLAPVSTPASRRAAPNAAGHDGRFTTARLAGRTLNVKA